MKKILFRVAAVPFFTGAFWVWWSFDYDNPGIMMMGQVLNWGMVAVIGTVGLGLWKMGEPPRLTVGLINRFPIPLAVKYR